jgi:electron transport complex protein RnfC
VVNGVESDPALSCTSALLRERAREIVEGTRIAMKILGLSAGALIAVSEADAGLVPAFERAIDSAGAQIGISVVSARYPQEHAQLLLAALDGRAAARGGRSRARGTAGVVILSAATLFAVYEAVVLAKPLTEGIVTVSGSPLAAPRNLKVRFGTPVADLVDDCGGLREEPGAVVMGGLMTGRVAVSLRVPVTKATTGVLLLSQKQARAAAGARPCIGCGRCLDACPWGLEPTRLYKLLDRGMADEARAEGLEDCSVCGCCAFVCPARIPLARGLDLGRRGRPLDGI